MDIFGIERAVSHDPCRWENRAPLGAVRAGEHVVLTLHVEKWLLERGCSVTLLVFDALQDLGAPSFEIPLEESSRGFAATIDTSGEPRVLFYKFHITVEEQTFVCTNRTDGLTTAGTVFRCDDFDVDNTSGFQLTIYDPGFETPAWFAGKTMYQIFPDRFARDHGDVRWDGVRSHEMRGWPVKVHQNWNESPDWIEPYEPVDFYGGTLLGIEEHLDYLADLGIDVVYLNPICEARSNHRYNTGDYEAVDPILGSWEELRHLSNSAAKRGIRIILDTVLSHTGAASKYFNIDNSYDSLGAAQSDESPYRSWYDFENGSEYAPYHCWWNDPSLPEIVEVNPSWQDFMLSDDGVLAGWSENGASGYRLDVADEIPDEVLEKVRSSVKHACADNVVIGEVWEDATAKVSYGSLRTYALGRSLDSVMNYPLRDYLIQFALHYTDAQHLVTCLKTQRSNYPRPLYDALMNLLSSHDVERIRSVLALGREFRNDSRPVQVEAVSSITPEMDEAAANLQRIVATFMYVLPGIPCLYYGDERGMQGGRDPFDRASFPWDGPRADVGCDLTGFYQGLGEMRNSSDVFAHGDASFYAHGRDVVIVVRIQNDADLPDDVLICVMNRSHEKKDFAIDLVRESAGLSQNASRELRYAPGTMACIFSSIGYDDGHDSLCLEDGIAQCSIGPFRSCVFRKSRGYGKALAHGLGVVCHITSLPGYDRDDADHAGIGDGSLDGTDVDAGFVASSKRFIDWLHEHGYTYWQVLPLNPTDEHGSPYAGLSAFAGNTRLLNRADYESVEFDEGGFNDFLRANNEWLLPYATFCSIKKIVGEVPWQRWPSQYRDWSIDLTSAPELTPLIDDELHNQYVFDQAWAQVRDYAASRGINIIGDMPFYISADSSDVWANRDYFELDEDGNIAVEGGVPPDQFAVDGQAWGVPVYNWNKLADSDYDWWIKRFQRSASLYDLTRLDHFIGFANYYAIPSDGDVASGYWCKGPGSALFEQAYKELGPLPIFAEDLGTITPSVRALLARCGLQGMDVIQFADGDPRYDWQPQSGKLIYTSTHDTQTLLGWVRSRYCGDANCAEIDDAYAGDGNVAAPDRLIADEFLDKARVAAHDHIVIMPLQDILGLDDSARMNTPGTTSASNWTWKAPCLPN